MNIQTLTFYNITQFAPQRRCNVYTKVTKNIQNIFDYIYLFLQVPIIFQWWDRFWRLDWCNPVKTKSR